MDQRLIEIAIDLGKLYQERIGAEIHKGRIESDLEARIVFMTPAEGWPGKNAEQREIEKARAIEADGPCQEMRGVLRELENDLADIRAEIDALEAERRGLEWMIRGRLADALSGRRENHMPVEEAAFDDGPLAAIDDQMVEELRRMPELPVHIGPEDVLEELLTAEEDFPF